MPQPQTVANWSAKAEAYERLSNRWEIFRKLSQRLVEMLPKEMRGAVLDIGGGAGLTSQILLARFPGCESILVEPAENMIRIAGRKLAGQRVRFLNMGLGEAADFCEAARGEAVTPGSAADRGKVAESGLRAMAAVASVSMQFLNLDEALGVLARVLAPGGHFAFNLWYHHWEETSRIPGMREWRAAAEVVCREAGLAAPAESAKKLQPAKTRPELELACERHGFRLLAEHRDSDLTPSRFGVDDEAMNPDWPLPGGAPHVREDLLRRMHELLADQCEPLVSTRFLLRKIV